MTREIGLVLLATWAPVSELRGGIPLGLCLGFDPLVTMLITIPANIVLFFPVFLILELFYERYLYKWKFFDSCLDRVRARGKPWVDKYGFLGLTLFVAIPLPVTGVYSGTALSWILKMDMKKAFLSITVGLTIAGTIVLLAALGIITGWESLLG